MSSNRRIKLVLASVALVALSAGSVTAKSLGPWSDAVSLESLAGSSADVNTAFQDGCPIQSPDGLSLYMASTRPGGEGGIDIWIAHRSSTDVGFGTPVNAGPIINSTDNDFCPTPVRGKGLYFVSNRPGGCGGPDMYYARLNPAQGWSDPVNLGCDVNSSAEEFSPSLVDEDLLYFSSNRAGTHDIYSSAREADGSFGAAQAVAELNTSTYGEFRPNVRKDGREIVFDSDRPGGLGATDIYAAHRSSVGDPFSAPENLGPAINSAAGESRASLSWDGTTLLFGTGRPGIEGVADIFISTR
jgi:Tol biopolymer transport system component